MFNMPKLLAAKVLRHTKPKEQKLQNGTVGGLANELAEMISHHKYFMMPNLIRSCMRFMSFLSYLAQTLQPFSNIWRLTKTGDDDDFRRL